MSKILYTDDYASFSVGYDDDNAGNQLPLALHRAGDSGPFWAVRYAVSATDDAFGRSSDGAAWEWFYDPLLLSAKFAWPSIAYDLRRDTLFVAYNGNPAVFGLRHASQVPAAEANAALAAAEDVLNQGVPGYWKLLPPIPDTTLGGIRALTIGRRSLT